MPNVTSRPSRAQRERARDRAAERGLVAGSGGRPGGPPSARRRRRARATTARPARPPPPCCGRTARAGTPRGVGSPPAAGVDVLRREVVVAVGDRHERARRPAVAARARRSCRAACRRRGARRRASGAASRDSGHRRVPAPPDRMTGTSAGTGIEARDEPTKTGTLTDAPARARSRLVDRPSRPAGHRARL